MSKELVNEVAGKFDLTKKVAKEVVDFVFDSLQEEIVSEGKVRIAQLGTFEVKQRNAREGRNPSTGETIKIAAKKAVTFKAGKAIKDAVNE